MKVEFKTKTGQIKQVLTGDLLFCALDQKPVRFVRMVDENTVEVSDNWTGKILPDWRHKSQLTAY